VRDLLQHHGRAGLRIVQTLVMTTWNAIVRDFMVVVSVEVQTVAVRVIRRLRLRTLAPTGREVIEVTAR